jgi:predicted ATPase
MSRLDVIEVENFRGFASAKLSSLTGMNILVGPNNSGKSTLLEAGLLASELAVPDSSQFSAALRYVVGRRGVNGERTISSLFWQRADLVPSFKVAGRLFRRVGSTTLEVGGVGEFPVALDRQAPMFRSSKSLFLDVDLGREDGSLEGAYTEAEDAGYRKQLVELLRPLLPEIVDLRLQLPAQGQIVLSVEESSRPPWPALSAGDGFKRLLILAARLSSAAGRVAFIEEPEVFMHPSALRQVAAMLWRAVGMGTQVFLATHSLELIEALLAGPSNQPAATSVVSQAKLTLDDLAVFRLRREAGVLSHSRLSGSKASERLLELGEDLRR